MTEGMLLLSTGIFGIFLGAQITEAVLFVPYWKAMAPDDFFELHKVYGKKIYRFFAPLTIASTILPLLSIYFLYRTNLVLSPWMIVTGAATLIFFSTFFIYFKSANRSFAERSLTHEELPLELKKWEKWHWTRIFYECIAFTGLLILLLDM